jgi:hypothetical protein
MKLSDSVKSISYLKAHASELLREISDEHKTLIITQNGEANQCQQLSGTPFQTLSHDLRDRR